MEGEVITSLDNANVKEARSLNDKKHRRFHGKFLIDGEKLVYEGSALAKVNGYVGKVDCRVFILRDVNFGVIVVIPAHFSLFGIDALPHASKSSVVEYVFCQARKLGDLLRRKFLVDDTVAGRPRGVEAEEKLVALQIYFHVLYGFVELYGKHPHSIGLYASIYLLAQIGIFPNVS